MLTAQQKAKLVWNCRRGMLELDLIFSRFIERQLDSLSDVQITAFEKLLQADDPELYTWLMGYANPMDKELVEIVAFIRLNHHA